MAPLRRDWIGSPNYSSRGGAAVRLIVLHTAEGATTYQSLGAYFANPASGVSSHVGIDDTPGVVGEYVRRENKAWTQANANPVAVSAELCAFASWSPPQWDTHRAMLENAARWVAEEAAAFGIPITRLSPAQAQGTGRGVCEHVDLGTYGGNHSDCGPNFPIDRVLEMARGEMGPTPAPVPPTPKMEDLDMLTSVLDADGNLTVYGIDPAGNLWEITTKDADANTPNDPTYRWSNLTANGGQKLAT